MTGLVGETPSMRQISERAEKAGRTRWPVLVLGETGTGKEVVARAIHAVRREGPFVTIDCSSMVGPLMESELFGHVRGSFTGATASKIGLIESANGGTAFLDEIGELPLDLQAKLLRVLQEKEFRPVGSLTQKRSDFRVIAATNRDLNSEVEKGAFRRDLFYRLNVVHIRLVPLRERKDDIQILIDHFLRRHGHGYTVTQEAMEALLAYDWPGNVRELEHCIQHMVALNSGTLLHEGNLPSAVQNAMRARRSNCFSMAVGGFSREPEKSSRELVHIDGEIPVPIPIAEVERQAIESALKYTKGDRAVAAHMLGIGRTTLYRKIKEYRLEAPALN